MLIINKVGFWSRFNFCVLTWPNKVQDYATISHFLSSIFQTNFKVVFFKIFIFNSKTFKLKSTKVRTTIIHLKIFIF